MSKLRMGALKLLCFLLARGDKMIGSISPLASFVRNVCSV